MSTRLRRTFAYPTEENPSDTDSLSDLDEEHQEALITSLRNSDAQKTNLYRKLYLLIPSLAGLLCVVKILSPNSGARQRVLALLALTTLVADAWCVWFLPLAEATAPGEGWGSWFSSLLGERGGSPVERYLLLLNGALAVLVSLAGTVGLKRSGEEVWEAMLPMGVFVVTIFVRELLRPVDLEGLERRRYGLKGA